MLTHPISLRRHDSNVRPLGYEPNELPTAPLRDFYFLFASAKVQHYFYSAKLLGIYLCKFAYD